MQPVPIRIFDVRKAISVPAVLRTMTIDDIAQWEGKWKPLLDDSGEEDSHWDWGEKYVAGSSRNFERFAIEQNGRTEGLMICETAVHLSRKRKLPIVYVDYLAVAPWNRPSSPNPEFRMVGSQMIFCATQLSHDLGYKCRVGLHSLPNAETFYLDLGMPDFGKDRSYRNLRYFEFDEATGRRFARE